MSTIWKFPIPKGEKFSAGIPEGGKILTARAPGGIPIMWALVEPENDLCTRNFICVWTGVKILQSMDELEYISTFSVSGLVYHLFEEIKR